MSEEIIVQTKEKMLKSLEALKANLSTIRTGRANSDLINEVTIEAYDTKMKLKELATINAPDPKFLLVHPYDQSITGQINRGIQEANLGLTPVVDGEIIRVIVPPLTEERRKEYVKLVAQRVEATRISIRQIRQDAMKDLDVAEKAGDINEDDKKRASAEIEDLNKEMSAEAQEIGEIKDKELMQI